MDISNVWIISQRRARSSPCSHPSLGISEIAQRSKLQNNYST
jgi:hypothetical protein